jgi:hypothetical protein
VKAQEEAPYCLACPTHKAIRNYSKTRFAAFAREAAVQLEQIEATGIFGDGYRHRTLWDEYCHEIQEGQHDPLKFAFDTTVVPIVQAIVEAIDNPEAILLTIGARWHLDEDQGADREVVATPDQIRRNLEDAIETLAMSRDMSEFDPTLSEEGPWPVRVEDVALLGRVAEAVRALSPLAQRGNDLIAVGEACDALERIRSSTIVDVNVGLTVGIRRGKADCFEEGHFASIRVNAREMILDQMDTTYASGFGADHYTTVCASLEPGGSGLNESGVAEWLSRVDWLRGEENAKLIVERDHV